MAPQPSSRRVRDTTPGAGRPRGTPAARPRPASAIAAGHGLGHRPGNAAHSDHTVVELGPELERRARARRRPHRNARTRPPRPGTPGPGSIPLTNARRCHRPGIEPSDSPKPRHGNGVHPSTTHPPPTHWVGEPDLYRMILSAWEACGYERSSSQRGISDGAGSFLTR